MAYQTVPHVLIVDDDEAICKTLSVILQAEGYRTTTATTAKEAIDKTKTTFFNLALLDIKLPDMDGIRLLAQLQESAPETIKIMITGYPSLDNAVEALNLGADSYIIKPIDPTELLETIKNKLEARQQAEKITKKDLVKWIQSQARKAQASSFQEFLEETATELMSFGLTKTQAKIYITLTALGLASASEIAATSKIRREEVYRIIPELEKCGIIMRRLMAPRKFSAIQPETALETLAKIKLKTMKEEIDSLKQKQVKLISKLKTIALPIQRDNCRVVDVLPKQDNLLMKLMDMMQDAKRQIDVIAPVESLSQVYLNFPKHLKEKNAKAVKIRVITRSYEEDVPVKEIIQYLGTDDNQIEWRQLEKLPFHLAIVDGNEAVWGNFQRKAEKVQNFWTNDPTQIAMLKTSFTYLWRNARIQTYSESTS